jgi:hypothetical protein
MKIHIALLAAILVICAGCSTTYYQYSGAKPIMGTGGASKTVDGIDLWIEGTPPIKFQILGVILDGRPGRGIAMAMRDSQVAALVKKQGGNAVLLSFDDREHVGSFSSGSSFTTGQATAFGSPGIVHAYGSANTTGSGFSQAITRRNSKYYVIRYLN